MDMKEETKAPICSRGSCWDTMSPRGGCCPAQGPVVLSAPARPLWTPTFLCLEVSVGTDGLWTVDTQLLSTAAPNPKTPSNYCAASHHPENPTLINCRLPEHVPLGRRFHHGSTAGHYTMRLLSSGLRVSSVRLYLAFGRTHQRDRSEGCAWPDSGLQSRWASCRFHRLLPPTFPVSPASPLKPVVGGPHRTCTELLVTNGSGLTLSQPTQPSCLGSFLKTSFLRPWEPQAPGVRPAPLRGSDTQRGRGWLNIMRTLAQARPGRRPGCVTVTGADSPVVGQTPLNY